MWDLFKLIIYLHTTQCFTPSNLWRPPLFFGMSPLYLLKAEEHKLIIIYSFHNDEGSLLLVSLVHVYLMIPYFLLCYNHIWDPLWVLILFNEANIHKSLHLLLYQFNEYRCSLRYFFILQHNIHSHIQYMVGNLLIDTWHLEFHLNKDIEVIP